MKKGYYELQQKKGVPKIIKPINTFISYGVRMRIVFLQKKNKRVAVKGVTNFPAFV